MTPTTVHLEGHFCCLKPL